MFCLEHPNKLPNCVNVMLSFDCAINDNNIYCFNDNSANYYMNNNQTLNSGLHHEVHTKEQAGQLCIRSTQYVGYFANEAEAATQAKKIYSDADGCATCCPKAHRGNYIARSSHHVVHNSKGDWDVKRSESQRSSGHYSTKEQAVNADRQISRNQGTEFVIHGLNGHIQSADSHGEDPYPPKG